MGRGRRLGKRKLPQMKQAGTFCSSVCLPANHPSNLGRLSRTEKSIPTHVQRAAECRPGSERDIRAGALFLLPLQPSWATGNDHEEESGSEFQSP